MNKRCLVVCWGLVLAFVCMFSNTVFAGEAEHIVNVKPIDGYKINATAPAVFESLTPDLVEIVRQDGQNVEINLHGEGDGYLAIHYRSGHEFIYHFIIKKDADDVSKFSVHDVAQQVLALVNEERRIRNIRDKFSHSLKLATGAKNLDKGADVKVCDSSSFYSLD